MILRRTSSVKTISITQYRHNRHTDVGLLTATAAIHDGKQPHTSLNMSQRTSQVVLLLLLLLLLSRFSHVRLCATPQTAAHQAPPSLGYSRQEPWSGLPFPSPVHESEK